MCYSLGDAKLSQAPMVIFHWLHKTGAFSQLCHEVVLLEHLIIPFTPAKLLKVKLANA